LKIDDEEMEELSDEENPSKQDQNNKEKEELENHNLEDFNQKLQEAISKEKEIINELQDRLRDSESEYIHIHKR
jgi:hypothetical protein